MEGVGDRISKKRRPWADKVQCPRETNLFFEASKARTSETLVTTAQMKECSAPKVVGFLFLRGLLASGKVVELGCQYNNYHLLNAYYVPEGFTYIINLVNIVNYPCITDEGTGFREVEYLS